MKTAEEILAENVRARREKKGMSQKELGKAAGGLSLQAIYKIESGKSNPRLSNLKEIARVLECTVEDLRGVEKKIVSMSANLTGSSAAMAQVIAEQQKEIEALKQSTRPLPEASTETLEKAQKYEEMMSKLAYIWGEDAIPKLLATSRPLAASAIKILDPEFVHYTERESNQKKRAEIRQNRPKKALASK